MRLLPFLCLLAFVLSAGTAHAEDEDPAALFAQGLDALASGRPSDAIAKLEAIGDRGVVDAAVSFDRGLAYAERVRAGAEQPGDLGHAVHGFEEALRLTRDPRLRSDATRALATVRTEIARRRARAGDTVAIDYGTSLGQSIVSVLPENGWALLSALCSIVFASALVARVRLAASRARVAASTTLGISGAVLAVTVVFVGAARDARRNVHEGVVVTPDLRLFDARRLALEGAPPVAEGTRVRILDEGGGFAHVALGTTEGWLPRSAVLPLARR